MLSSSQPEALVRCTCGVSYSVEEWRAIPRVGITDIELTCPAGPGEEVLEPFESRTCPRCGSTISTVIPYPGGTTYPPPMPEE
jgi:hypothetical protein